jgi:hypothetical protein
VEEETFASEMSAGRVGAEAAVDRINPGNYRGSRRDKGAQAVYRVLISMGDRIVSRLALPIPQLDRDGT